MSLQNERHPPSYKKRICRAICEFTLYLRVPKLTKCDKTTSKKHYIIEIAKYSKGVNKHFAIHIVFTTHFPFGVPCVFALIAHLVRRVVQMFLFGATMRFSSLIIPHAYPYCL